MFIYNVTAHVEPSVEKEWLEWMEQEHIPEMHKTQKISTTKLFEILSDQDLGGKSYAVQYHMKDKSAYKAYLKENAAAMKAKVQHKFGDQILFFRTGLELIKSCP